MRSDDKQCIGATVRLNFVKQGYLYDRIKTFFLGLAAPLGRVVYGWFSDHRGATGSLLAFYPELERLINPQLYPEQSQANKLDIATLAELTQQRVPHGRVDWVVVEGNQHATVVSMSARSDESGQSSELGFDQLILDPYSGEELGRRQFGAISEG